MNKLLASALIGLFLVRQFVLRNYNRLRALFGRPRPDSVRLFADYYRADRLTPYEDAPQLFAFGAGGCIRCGLCDARLALLQPEFAHDAPPFTAFSFVVSSHARDFSEMGHARALFSAASRVEPDPAAGVCPVGLRPAAVARNMSGGK